MDYESSLDRAMDEVPDIESGGERLEVPDAAAQKDGAFTRLTNLSEIADTLGRDQEHVHRFVQRELGTNGQLKEGVARYNGNFSGRDFDAALDKYTDIYVLCGECGLPDTRLVTEDRTEMLRCDACGAFRPVTEQTGASTASRSTTPGRNASTTTSVVRVTTTHHRVACLV